MTRQLHERAIRTGAFTGTSAVASYLLWSIAPLPADLNTVLHFAFGPLPVLDLSTFPTPPAEAGLFDLGPFVGLWFGGFCVRMFRRAKPPLGSAA